MADFYEILGVPREASAPEIRSAFRRLAREHHPDVSQAPEAETKFAEIAEAYRVLSNAELRSDYDRGTYDSRPVRTEPPRESARRRAARVRAYKVRINSVINDMLEAERREARFRAEAVMITVTLFLSTLFVAAARPSASIAPYGVVTQIVLWGLCLLGVWQFVRSLHLVLEHFTYRPRVLSVTDENLPPQPFSRATAWGFLILGYAVSLAVGGVIGKIAFSDPTETFTALDFLHDACVFPPIAILAVINFRRLEEFLHRI